MSRRRISLITLILLVPVLGISFHVGMVVQAELPTILVVSDDDAYGWYGLSLTGVEHYKEILDSLGYTYNIWNQTESGNPSLENLQQYDVVIWTCGIMHSAPDGNDRRTLENYTSEGGRLLLSAAWSAYVAYYASDWSFMENVLHAEYVDWRANPDFEVRDATHPIAREFTQGETFNFSSPYPFTSSINQENQGYIYENDVVNPVAGGVEVFERGPRSIYPNASTVIASEDDATKIVYIVAPIWTFPEPQRTKIVTNVLNWFIPPTISTVSPEDKTYAVNDVPLTFTVSESTDWMGYSLDGQANVTITGNTTLSGLSDGSHSLIVYAKDTAGNMRSSNTLHFTVDTVLPTIEILSPQNTTYAESSVSLSCDVDETAAWMGYSLDGQANVTITGDVILSDLSEGPHTLIIYAEDDAGNAGASELIHFSIETPPPSEPFPVWIIAALVIVGGAVVGVLVYFTKIKKS